MRVYMHKTCLCEVFMQYAIYVNVNCFSRHTFIDKDKQISSLAGGLVYDIFGNAEDSLVKVPLS